MSFKSYRAFYFCIAVITLLVGCGSAPKKQSIAPDIVTEEFSEPLHEPLTVGVGESIYSRGKVAYKENLRLTEFHEGKMPGAYRVPFSYSIEPTVLEHRFARGEYDFYCADDDKAFASFPGLGSVIANGDCVGIRQHQTTGKKYWVVDNSIHNRQTTVWFTEYDQDQDPELLPDRTRYFEQGLEVTEIRFDGFYSGLLHFTLMEHEASRTREREFKFDYPPRQGDAVYGIRGQIFEVIDVSNVDMVYQWKRLN